MSEPAITFALPVELVGVRVLILEDEPFVSAILESAVLLAGYEIVGPATDIGSALALIAAEQIDAAILDLVLDGAYCDEVADELRNRNIPFAITTGIGPIKDHPGLASAVCITKPFRAQYIQDVLAKLLLPACSKG